MSNEVSTIVPTAKIEKVEYKMQWFCYSHHHWINIMYFDELEQARRALLRRRKESIGERYRIVKSTIIDEVVE